MEAGPGGLWIETVTLIVRGNRVGVAEAVKDWHDTGWTVTQGCTKHSDGCQNCLAATLTARTPGMEHLATPADGDVHRGRWTGKIDHLRENMAGPERWPEHLGRLWVFVGQMGDLFHDDVPDAYIDEVLAVASAHPQHYYGFLTKRSARMRDFFATRSAPSYVLLGVSVESPKYLYRVDDLLACRGDHVPFVQAEPLLNRLDLSQYFARGLGWVVAGPELGVHARPYDIEWFRFLRDQCADAGVPFFMKHQLDGVEHQAHPTMP